MTHKPVIGIIGGGQLGRMFIEEALRYNIECIIVDADKNCPASVIAHEHIVGSISEAAPLMQLAEKCDVLTYEIEHIYIDALLELEKKGKKLIPSPKILQMIQDKGAQKNFYRSNNIPTADFEIASSPAEWKNILQKKNWNRFAAKLCRDGYDGKG
ncbi:MAG TPA: 5-(carboxyamino)imidazole ribonucleotide synthase, partial [Bacteroidetes bacterium]|nr:5-(carboxyamino)imidazole ribonucleotide synthase [Bacteroidota bacterium]